VLERPAGEQNEQNKEQLTALHSGRKVHWKCLVHTLRIFFHYIERLGIRSFERIFEFNIQKYVCSHEVHVIVSQVYSGMLRNAPFIILARDD